jgi:hypothetical protein
MTSVGTVFIASHKRHGTGEADGHGTRPQAAQGDREGRPYQIRSARLVGATLAVARGRLDAYRTLFLASAGEEWPRSMMLSGGRDEDGPYS